MNVLIAEGDARVGEVLARMLDVSGHFSVSVSNLDDAILAQRAKSFDAYIIDLDFPDCGGIAVLGALRKESGASPAARAIGWTTLGHLWRGRPVTSLFDAVVEKPAPMRTVLAALQGRAQSPSPNSPDSAWSTKSCEWWPQSGWRLD